MAVTICDFLGHLDAVIPFSLAESWDNCGLQVGRLDAPATKILVALDVTMEVMAAALDWKADLVLTHHPLMITPLKQLDFNVMPGAAVALSAVNNISIVSLHTNLDKARGGLNDYFSQMLGLTQLVSLQPSFENNTSQGCPEGIGRVGRLSTAMTLAALGDQVKKTFGAEYIRRVGPPDMMVDTVAVCTGSGESLLNDVYNSGAQVYITGDLKYHGARDIESFGMGAIDLGHFASEHIVIDLLVDKVGSISMQEKLNLDVKGYTGESEPFAIQ